MRACTKRMPAWIIGVDYFLLFASQVRQVLLTHVRSADYIIAIADTNTRIAHARGIPVISRRAGRLITEISGATREYYLVRQH